jgi:hypothetical protein
VSQGSSLCVRVGVEYKRESVEEWWVGNCRDGSQQY